MVQLNGSEGESFCAEVARRTGVKVIKAIHVASAADIHAAESYRTDFHLFDRRGKGQWGGTGQAFDWELLRGHRSEVPAILAGGLRARQRRRRDRGRPPLRGRRRQRRRARARAARTTPRWRPSSRRRARSTSRPDERGRGALRPLRGALRAGDADRRARRAEPPPGPRRARTPGSAPGWSCCGRDFVGRPTPLYLAERLSERVGSRVYLKREDLSHTGSHKINNALGQTLLAERMGKRRIIAETGAGQHGVATATACALLGLECVVYMGSEDIRRQAPNVERMKLLGAEVEPVRGRRADAEGGGLGGDPRLGRQRRDDPLRDRLGGRAGALPGAGPRPAAGDRRGGARAGARRRGRAAGAGDRLRRRRLQRDRHLHPVRRRRGRRPGRGRGGAARGWRAAATAPRSAPARPASCTARSPRSSPTRRARSSRRTRSRPGSTTRARAPSTPGCATPAGPATSRSPTSRRWRRSASWPGSRA